MITEHKEITDQLDQLVTEDLQRNRDNLELQVSLGSKVQRVLEGDLVGQVPVDNLERKDYL